jgi:hypothetical protein
MGKGSSEVRKSGGYKIKICRRAVPSEIGVSYRICNSNPNFIEMLFKGVKKSEDNSTIIFHANASKTMEADHPKSL